MKKIAHVFSHFNIGGAQTMLSDIMNIQVETCDITLFVLLDDVCKSLIDSLDKRIKIVLLKRKIGSFNYLPYLKLNLMLNFGGYDIVHAHEHTMWKHIYLAPWVKRYHTVHNTGMFSEYYKKCVKIFAISRSVEKGLTKKGFSNVILAPNGINCNIIQKRHDTTIHFNEFKIVQVSRLIINHKGQDLLLKAIYKIKEKLTLHIIVDFIGDGNDKKQLTDMVHALNLEDNVNFLGGKDRNYVYSHLKDYNLFVQPSRYEGFGLTVAEAMAANVPVLVSKNEGPFEIIKEGAYGYYFENEDSDSLAEKLLYIINNYGEAIAKAKNGIEYVKENYNVKKTAYIYLGNYGCCK